MFNITMRRLLLAGAAAVMLAPVSAFAVPLPVYGTNIGALDYAPVVPRSIGGGLTKPLGGGTATAATINWVITPVGGHFHYAYTFTTNSAQGVGHLNIDLSDNCVSGAVGGTGALVDTACFYNLTTGPSGSVAPDYGSIPANSGNPFMPAAMIGAQATFTGGLPSFTLAFDSNRVPVWEDIYGKWGNPGGCPGRGCNGLALFNTGFGAEGTDSNTLDFIALPDSAFVQIGVVPEPATLALFGAGLAGLGALRRRRKAKA